MGIISIKNLIHDFKRHDDETEEIVVSRVLNGVELDVEKGDFISILGRNGSGKSTLAKHINALLYPTEGKVYVNNIDTSDEKQLIEVRKTAGMVFQNPDNQIIASVVEEDVAFGPENLGIPSQEIYTRVISALGVVDMLDYKNHRPNNLSGGQKQRVAIAGVLAMKPKCLILDEPTAMLDPIGRKEVLEVVHKLNKEEGMTVILVTHHMDEVVDSDKIYIMHKGNIALSGTPKEVFAHTEELLEFGLFPPTHARLSYELRKMGIDFPVTLNNKEFFEALKNTNKINETIEYAPTVKRNFYKEEIIGIEHVGYVYDEKTAFAAKVLDDINVSIRAGEFLAVIGHTGSGKSTFIQTLNGLLQPSEGKISFRGSDINAEKYNKRELRQKVGLVFQYPDYQLFEQTVLKDVGYGPKNMGFPKDVIEAKSKEALRLVGVKEEEWEMEPLTLSGGEKKRVSLAGVLAMNPEVLILDEPTAGLDPVGRKDILDKIYEIHKETGVTVILVSHNMEDVAQYADRVLVFEKGKKFLEGTPDRVFKHSEDLKKIGLSVPAVTDLFEYLKNEGINVPTNIYTEDEAIKCLSAILELNS